VVDLGHGSVRNREPRESLLSFVVADSSPSLTVDRFARYVSNRAMHRRPSAVLTRLPVLAMITATYTLVNQLIGMKSFPAIRISHTSSLTAGQVYVPAVNWLLMIGTIATVAGFGSSFALTLAYGSVMKLGRALSTSQELTSSSTDADSPSPPSCSSPRPSSVFKSRSSKDITGVSDSLSSPFSDFSMVSRTDCGESLSVADHASILTMLC